MCQEPLPQHSLSGCALVGEHQRSSQQCSLPITYTLGVGCGLPFLKAAFYSLLGGVDASLHLFWLCSLVCNQQLPLVTASPWEGNGQCLYAVA